MSRSRRKTKIMGIAGGPRSSDKKDKQFCNRATRRKVRSQIQVGDYDTPLPLQKEVVNTYSMSKDGKHTFEEDKYLRK